MQQHNITIRKAIAPDIPVIRDLALRIWPPTYGSILSQAQLEYMLNLLYSEKALVQQMEEGAEFLLAYEAEEPVGFSSAGFISPGVYKLHKLYVLPSQQGKGTGRLLVENVINNVKQKGATSLLLNVNRHNNARRFYEKIGFSVTMEEDIDIGNGYFMNDYVMEKKLAGD